MDITIKNTLQQAAAITSLNAVNNGSSVNTPAKSAVVNEETPTHVAVGNAVTVAKNTDHVKQAVNQLNNHIQAIQRNLQFSVDHGTMVVKIIDTQSNRVIQQIPTEAALNLAQALTASEDNKKAFNLLSLKA